MVEPSKSPSNLEQRLAALHQVSMQLMEEQDFRHLLHQIADFAIHQIGASYVIVGVHQPGEAIPECVTQRQAFCREFIEPPSAYCVELHELVHKHREPTRFTDVRTTDSPRIREFFDLPTPFLGLPLYRGEYYLGGIYLLGREGGGLFNKDDEMVLEILATYASIAISNTRLTGQLSRHNLLLQQRNESLSLLTNLASTMSDIQDLQETLHQLVEQLMSYLNIDVAEVYLRQEEGWLLKQLFHIGGDPNVSLWGSRFIRYGDGPVGLAARTKQVQHDLLPGCGYCHNAEHNGTEQCQFKITSLPLAGQNDVFGVLCVGTCEYEPLDKKEESFLMAITTWLGVMLENQRLIESRQRLAVLEERERIGMDLHDGVIQSIYAVGLALEHIRLIMNDNPRKGREVLDQAIHDLNSTIRDIRLYILDLRPRKLHDEDLSSGILRLVNEFRVNALINVNFAGPKEGVPELTQPQATAMFHICQEALANVAKHAQATQVGVNVWKSPERILMEIHDDGRGFKVNDARFTLGHGLSNMQTRANNAGGEVEITSARGQGTTILAWVPIPTEGLPSVRENSDLSEFPDQQEA
ncbi:MAG: GAF domain-containing sensor histidine kinase [Anaerolineae bacterium]|jgi:signal transduction histidine kinase|nr:GAF domain-containing sensor histidine kinase [Anaerolineae bacterium]